jgi:hypothetical protein
MADSCHPTRIVPSKTRGIAYLLRTPLTDTCDHSIYNTALHLIAFSTILLDHIEMLRDNFKKS